MISERALKYIQDKKLAKSFSYKDIWNEEHATAFTVAKVMQFDVLEDIKSEIEKAIERGETFVSFKKNLLPVLRQKGWTGKQIMIDPVSGETKEIYIDTARRLKTIYNTNLRSAYMKSRYDATMQSEAHSYLMYRLGPVKTKHREEHAAWDGLILSKDDPWWNSHMPPNGYGCKCYVVAVTEDKKKKYENEGLPIAIKDGETSFIQVKTTAPKTIYKTYVNERKGIIEKVPTGVHPSFNFNQGLTTRDLPVFDAFMKRGSRKFKPYENGKSLAVSGFPKEVEKLAESILTSQIKKEQFESWIDTSFNYTRGDNGNAQKHNMTAIGFIDSFVAGWLKKNTGIDIGESITVGLESMILNSKKTDRHGKKGEALSRKDADYILQCMLKGNVYFQDDEHQNLLYLLEVEKGKYIQIAVAPDFRIANSGSLLKIPTVRNIQFLYDSQIISKYNKNSVLKKIK